MSARAKIAVMDDDDARIRVEVSERLPDFRTGRAPAAGAPERISVIMEPNRPGGCVRPAAAAQCAAGCRDEPARELPSKKA
jgi:hypothetical protein